MKKETISKKQMQLLIFIYPIGSYLLFNMGAEVEQDAWIASIIGVLLTIPVLLVYGRLMNLYPGKNLFDILDIVFGKILGKVLNIIFIFHFIFLGAYILNDFTDFIKLSALWNTPMFIPILIIGILSIFTLKKGIITLFNWAKFNIRFVLIFIILSWILLLPKIQFSNLQPFFYHSFKEIFKTALSLMTFPFTELFIFLGFFDCIEDKDSNIKNIFIKPLLIVGLFATSIMIVNLMILGGKEYSICYFSGYTAMKKLHLRGEYKRLEIVISIIFTIIQFLEINYCILASSKGVQKVFNLNDYRDILVPVVFFILNLSYLMFGSIMETQEFAKSLWIFYGTISQIILPIIIFVISSLKKQLST